jgi:hypothetical protein
MRGKSCNIFKEIRFVGLGWISSVHDKGKWWAVEKMAVKCLVSYNVGITWLCEETVAYYAVKLCVLITFYRCVWKVCCTHELNLLENKLHFDVHRFVVLLNWTNGAVVVAEQMSCELVDCCRIVSLFRAHSAFSPKLSGWITNNYIKLPLKIWVSSFVEQIYLCVCACVRAREGGLA